MLLVHFVFAIGLAAQSGGAFNDLSARARAAREANNVPLAIELYKQAVESNPNWEEGWWFLGSLLYDSDQYAAGRDALKRVIKMDANAVPAWALLGLCEFETGDYNAALEHVQRALEGGSIAPQMESVLRYRQALLLTHNGEYDSALKAYVWFARLGVRNPELILGIGLAALRAPMLPKEIPQERQDLYVTAGRAAYASMSGDLTGAQAALGELLERFPNEHYVHYLDGCFLLASKPDVAMAELRRELVITPRSGAASAMLAWVLLEHGDMAEARPYAEAAAANDPALPLAQYVFGRALLEDGKLASSIEHLKAAEEGDPGNIETHMSLATAYSKAARPTNARDERMKTLALLKENEARANP